MRKLDVKGKFKIVIIALSLSLLVTSACNSSSNKEEESSEVGTDTLKTMDEPMLMPDSTLMKSDTGGGKGGQPAPPIRK
ncbi:MAG: hypothetical protein JWQ40_4487 [Segetibacter sp.]|jgi:hypothetical protein|nr:hypothetical protein [Segetibacter sp.]